MEIDRGDICRYLDFLRDEPGYCITLHGEPAEWPEFVRYNFHPNPYCHYVKTVCECWSECIARQRKVTAACRDGAFFGICYAGVGEYVYPLTADGVQIGFLSVSGYLGHDESTAREKAAHFARRYHAPAAAIGRMRTKYLRPAPPQETVDAVVRPLCHMLAAYAQQRRICPRGDDLYTQALRYITVHHHERLTMRSGCWNNRNFPLRKFPTPWDFAARRIFRRCSKKRMAFRRMGGQGAHTGNRRTNKKPGRMQAASGPVGVWGYLRIMPS